ncbi:hypothetical protein BJ928_103446 [Rhizobium sp. WW_1]|jgi:hypothetical protein|nr:hypothetical protein BJ928_103446 [Rhizobium sp. WW_1]
MNAVGAGIRFGSFQEGHARSEPSEPFTHDHAFQFGGAIAAIEKSAASNRYQIIATRDEDGNMGCIQGFRIKRPAEFTRIEPRGNLIGLPKKRFYFRLPRTLPLNTKDHFSP